MQNPSDNASTNYIKIGQAAKTLGVSIDTLRRWEKAGKIETVRTPGGTRLYSLESLRKINPESVANFQAQSYTTEELLQKTGNQNQPFSVIASATTKREAPLGWSEATWQSSPTMEDSSLASLSRRSGLITQNDNIIKHSFVTKLLIATGALLTIALLVTSWITVSYLTSPKETKQFFSNSVNNIASGILSPFHFLAGETVAVIAPGKARELGLTPPNPDSTKPDNPPPLPDVRALRAMPQQSNKPSNVLAVTGTTPFLEVNSTTQINGSLFVRDCINGLNLQATPSASPVAGCTSLTVSKPTTIDQDVSTAASPTFNTINLSGTKNQIVLQSGGPAGTLTWTPTTAQTITFPNATGTVVLDSATQTLTNKTINGGSNTITNISNSSLSNSSITVSAGTNLSGGGTVSLGGSISLALKDSVSLGGTLAVTGATTLSSTLAVTGATTLTSNLTVGGVVYLADGTAAAPSLTFTNDTDTGLYRIGANKIGLITGGSATSGITIDSLGNLGIGTISPGAALEVNGQVKITGGTPGSNKVLTSDAAGLATWTTVAGVGGITGSGTAGYVPVFDSSSSIANSSTIWNSGGNVGIGTISPGSKLAVSGNVGIGVSFATAVIPTNGLAVQGNVGIGTTSPTNPLTVIGNANITGTLTAAGLTNTGTFLAANGSASTPSYSFSNLTNAGLWTNGDGLLLTTGGSNTFGITVTGSGNVGIGTTSPAQALQVNGAGYFNTGTYIGANSTNNLISAASTGSGSTQLYIGNLPIATTGSGGSLTGSTNQVGYFTETNTLGGSNNFWFNGSNVGIGTTSPGSALTVIGNVGIGTSSAGSALQVNGGGTFGWGTAAVTGPANGLGISGNLGIGTTSPNNKLQVIGAGVIGGDYGGYTAPSNGLLVQGNVGIGTSAPGYLLDINGVSRFAQNINLNSGASIIPLANGGSDLGSSSYKFNNLYVNNINSNSTLSSSGQAVFTYQPASNAISEGSVYINPTTATSGRPLLSLAVGGTEKARITTDGYLGLGGANDPGTSYILNAGSLFNIGTGGNVGIGFTTPDRLTQISSDINITSSIASLLGANGSQFSITGSTAANLQKKLTLGIDTTDNYGVIQTGNTSGTAYSLALNPGGGNVGIGTTSPSAVFDVFSTGTGTNGINLNANSLTTGTGLNLSSTSTSLSSGNLIAGNHTATYTSANTVSGDILNLSRSLTTNFGVGFDAVSSSNSSSTTSLTWSHTIGSGSNRLLVVGISAGSSSQVNSVTYNGTALTRVGTIGSSRKAEIWIIKEANLPSAGTYNVVISLQFATEVIAGATSWTGVDQTTPTGSFNSASGSGFGPISSTISSATGDVVFDVITWSNTISPDASQTQQWNTKLVSATSGAASTKAGASSVTMTWSQGAGNVTYGYGAVSIKHAPLAISGDLASLSSNCTISSGSCTDSASILKLTQSYSSATGAVLSITNSGTGPAAIFSGGNVGIGASVPQAKLVIQGNVGIGYSGANQAIPVNGLAVSGNVGIGITTANSNLAISGNAHIGSLYQGISAPTNGLFVDGNVGIGATTSSNKLDVWGNERIAGTSTIDSTLTVGGVTTLSAANGALSFTGSTPSITSGSSVFGLFAGGNVGIGTTGNLYGGLTIKGAGTGTNITLQTYGSGLGQGLTVLDNGNVGIGTTNPTQQFLVYNTSHAYESIQTSASNKSAMNIYNNSAVSWFAGIGYQNGNNYVISKSDDTSANVKFVLDTNGNVGIGTTNPATKLDVTGSVTISRTNTVGYRFDNRSDLGMYSNGSFGTYIAAPDSVSINIDANNNDVNTQNFIVSANGTGMTAGNALFVINETGNIGLGGYISDTTLFTGANMVFKGGNVGIGVSANSPVGALQVGPGAAPLAFFVGNNGNVGIGNTAPSASLQVNGNTSNPFVVTSGGNLGIGFTSPDRKLQIAADLAPTVTVAGLINTANSSQLSLTGSTAGNLPKKMVLGIDTTNNFGYIQAGNASGTAYNLSLQPGGGNVGIGTTSPVSLLNLYSTDSTTTAATFNFSGLSSGTGLYLTSASTALSTGSLLSLDWSPGGTTTATGDLLSVNVGANGTIGNLLNLKNNGSSVFSVSQTAITASIPTAFTAAGDVSIAYDLNFTNPTASYIKSSAPLYIQSGESFNSSDLNLTTFNQGQIFLNSANGVYAIGNVGIGVSYNAVALPNNGLAVQGNVGIGTTTASNALQVVGSSVLGFTPSAVGPASGLAVSGNVGIGTTTANSNLSVSGNAHIGSIRQGISAPTDGLFVDGNVGIGATTSSNKLDVWGNSRLAGTLTVDSTSTFGSNLTLSGGQFLAPNGTAVLPSHSFTNDSDTGLWSAGTNIVALTANGSGSLQSGTTINGLSVNANGNVGIGTTSPGAKLEIDTATVSTTGLILNSTDDSAVKNLLEIQYQGNKTAWIGRRGNLFLGSGAATQGAPLLDVSGNSLRFGSDNTAATRTDNTQKVGYFTLAHYTNATKSVAVLGGASSATNNTLDFGGGTSDYTATTWLRFFTATDSTTVTGTERMRIDGSGNIGIGSTNPGTKLAVSGAGTINWGGTSSIAVSAGTGLAVNGNVGIGTTSPAQALEVNGRIRMDTWTADGTTAVYYNSANGDIGVQSSDIRLKTNITPVQNALDIIGKINGVTFNWLTDKEGAQKTVGVIAQDVMQAMPELIFPISGPDGKSYYGVHYDKLAPVLINAVKEQQAQINNLTNRQASDSALLKSMYLDGQGNLIIPKLKTGSIILDPSLTIASLTNTPGAGSPVPSAVGGDSPGVNVENKLISMEDRIKALEAKLLAYSNATPSAVLAEVTTLSEPEASRSATSSATLTEATPSANPVILASPESTASDSGVVAFAPPQNDNAAIATSSASTTTEANITATSSAQVNLTEATSSATPSASTTYNLQPTTSSELNLTPPSILLATQSAQLVNLNVTSEATVSGLLTAYNLNIQNGFKSLGTTSLGTTTIAGDLTVDGTMSVTQNSINVIGISQGQTLSTQGLTLTSPDGILYLQNSILAQGLDVLNGQFTFNKDGTLTVNGEVLANQFSVKQDTSSGVGKLAAGQINTFIGNSYADEKSVILITPHTPLNQTLGVTNRFKGGFIVQLARPEPADIRFDYLIIGVKP